MSYKIPLFKLNYDEQEETAVIETLRSKWISIGPKCEELEATFSQILGGGPAVSTTNCTASLHLAMKALGIGKGDEVIVPSLSFAATVNAVLYVGAIPVFADIKSPEDLNIDPTEIEKKITRKTKAIIVMHYAGFPCDIDEIVGIAKSKGLHLVEDACHGPLSEYKGKKLGTIGDFGCFSFFSNKNLSTGEGGIIISKSAELANKVKLLRSHGMTTMSYQRASGHATKYDIVELGYNYRMDDIRATLGIVQLKKLEQDLKKRAIVRQNYLDALKGMHGITIPFKNNAEFVSNYIFPVVLKDSSAGYREQIRGKLHAAGIQTSVHYPAIHKFSIYKDYYCSLPVTEYVTDNEITLPMYGDLSTNDVEMMASTLKKVLKK